MSSKVSQIVFSFDRFKAYYNCMSLNFKNVISPWVQSTSITNRVLSPIDRFTACYNCMSKNFQNVSWVHRYHKSCSQADLTVLVITIVWTKTSKMSYIREFSVEVSQIVFSAHLTVLRRLINKYHKSCSQLIWPFYGLLELHAVKLQKSNISVSSEQKYHKSCSQLIWPF